MKTLIFLSLFLPAFILVSQEAAVSFKKCNTIQVHADPSLKDLADALHRAGYSVAKTDQEMATISSGPFKVWKSSGHQGVIEIWKMDGSTWITATASVTMLGSSSAWKMEKRGTGTVQGKLFAIVDQFASALGDDLGAGLTYYLK